MARLLGIAMTIAAAMTIMVGPAAADPVNNPHTFALAITCANGVSDTVYPTGAAGHAAGSTSVGILLAQTGPGAFSTPGFELSDLTACTSAQAPGVTFYVLITPRRG
jgi:hypothetical protein